MPQWKRPLRIHVTVFSHHQDCYHENAKYLQARYDVVILQNENDVDETD